jgi:hypothetical protein
MAFNFHRPFEPTQAHSLSQARLGNRPRRGEGEGESRGWRVRWSVYPTHSEQPATTTDGRVNPQANVAPGGGFRLRLPHLLCV